MRFVHRDAHRTFVCFNCVDKVVGLCDVVLLVTEHIVKSICRRCGLAGWGYRIICAVVRLVTTVISGVVIRSVVVVITGFVIGVTSTIVRLIIGIVICVILVTVVGVVITLIGFFRTCTSNLY